jgi:GTP-binding protein
VDRGLERQMVLKTIKALSRAEVAVLMLDAAEGLTGQDLRIIGLIEDQGKGCLVLMNKWDLVRHDVKEARTLLDKATSGLEFMAYAPVLPVSVATGYNLRRVFPLIAAIHSQGDTRVGTRELNRLLRPTERTPPPRSGPPREVLLPHPTRGPASHLRGLRQPARWGSGPLPTLFSKTAAGKAGPSYALRACCQGPPNAESRDKK